MLLNFVSFNQHQRINVVKQKRMRKEENVTEEETNEPIVMIPDQMSEN
jgi:hypothetical protein